MNKTIINIIFCVIITIIGCNSLTPAGFWKSYHSNLIIYKTSDQGPWGGTRVIQWESRAAGVLSENEALEYSKENDWKLLERSELTSQELSKWTGCRNKQVFIAINGNLSCNNDDFPRHIFEDAILLKFDSGWIRENPGTGETSTAYGYILVSKDKKKMAMYHFWGNG